MQMLKRFFHPILLKNRACFWDLYVKSAQGFLVFVTLMI